MNNTVTGFQVIDISDLALSSNDYSQGLYDRINALTKSKKPFILKLFDGKAFLVSNANMIVDDYGIEIKTPLDDMVKYYRFTVDNTDYYSLRYLDANPSLASKSNFYALYSIDTLDSETLTEETRSVENTVTLTNSNVSGLVNLRNAKEDDLVYFRLTFSITDEMNPDAGSGANVAGGFYGSMNADKSITMISSGTNAVIGGVRYNIFISGVQLKNPLHLTDTIAFTVTATP